MRKSILRSVGLTLSLAMVTGSLIGCSPKEVTETKAPVENAGEVVKPESIVMTTDTFLKPEDGMADFTTAFKAQEGIDLKITQPVHNQYYEKLSLQYASGAVPDVLEIGGSALTNYASKGALLDLTSLIENSEILKGIDKKYTDAIKVNGKIFAFPLQSGGGTITYLRQDWLDACKLKVPTTYDEFITVLKAFKELPDSNGNKTKIPYSAAGLISDDLSVPATMYVREFYQDAMPDFTQVDGKWVDGMAQPNMKDALGRLRTAYSDGLIDKEIITNKTSSVRDKFYAGKIGAFTYWAGDWNRVIETNLQKAIATGEVVAIPAIKETNYIERAPLGIAISSKAKNPEGIFKYLIEFMHDGDKGEMIFSNGIKDLNYTVKDGVSAKVPSKLDANVLFPKIYKASELSITNFKNPIEVDQRTTDSLATFKKDAVLSSLLPASDVLTKAIPDLLTIKKEVISKIVYGELSIEEGLAKYSKDSKTLVDSVLGDLNK
jgi:putative aldouronate transport system substrate-binding protein